MRVLVTGGAGFVGSYVCRALMEAGHEVRCLVRNAGTGRDALEVVGDLFDEVALRGATEECDAVVHLVGIIRETRAATFDRIHAEGTRRMVAAARRAGIDTFVHMSANGARMDGVSRYQTSKWRAEEIVRSAGFRRWTIFRPSVIFGRPGRGQPEFCTRLARTLVGPFPVLPVFGDGRYRLRPIAVEDVARAFEAALRLPAAAARTFCAAGPEGLTYVDALDTIALGMGLRPKPKARIPLPLVRPVVGTLGRWGLLPITPDQLRMLLDGNDCDPSEFVATFGGPLERFEAGRLAYLRS